MPFLPTLFTNYFANLFFDGDYDEDGKIDTITCTSISPDSPTPPVCIKAHSTVVVNLNSFNIILNTLLNFEFKLDL